MDYGSEGNVTDGALRATLTVVNLLVLGDLAIDTVAACFNGPTVLALFASIARMIL